MALRCLGTGGNRERLEIIDSTPLHLPAGGWFISAMFYPDTSVGINTFAYIYAHGSPANDGNDGMVILLNSSGTARVIVTDVFAIQYDLESSTSIVPDTWNHVAVSYQGGFDLRLYLNGVESIETSGFLLGLLTPPGNARIGDANHGSGREFNGRIAHVSKWDRDFSPSDANHFTSLLISPEFAQIDHIWHVPVWNASFNNDQLNTVTTNPVGALYGNHAPAQYPGDPSYVVPPPPQIPTNQSHRIQWSMA